MELIDWFFFSSIGCLLVMCAPHNLLCHRGRVLSTRCQTHLFPVHACSANAGLGGLCSASLLCVFALFGVSSEEVLLIVASSPPSSRWESNGPVSLVAGRARLPRYCVLPSTTALRFFFFLYISCYRIAVSVPSRSSSHPRALSFSGGFVPVFRTTAVYIVRRSLLCAK